ncbi:MAG: DUF218 domain-containing protein [Clostridiaceae bacterium]|jgi:SanA protein|nr:DUF218 domain-containing protein [Clostridiaceae bacterium]
MFSSKNRTTARQNKGIWHYMFYIAAFLILLLFIGLLLINRTVVRTGRARIRDLAELERNLDAIIVPGCKVDPDLTPSPMLKDRLDGAIELYQAGISERIIVSGDSSEKAHNEPWVMRNYLAAAGIPPEAIFIDRDGIDTYDTVFRARAIFGVRTGVIATQTFHLERALYIADRLEIDLLGYATDFYDYSTATKIKNSIRDFLARAKAWYETETKAAPRHLGETIDLAGSGYDTLDAEQKQNDPYAP